MSRITVTGAMAILLTSCDRCVVVNNRAKETFLSAATELSLCVPETYEPMEIERADPFWVKHGKHGKGKRGRY